VEADEVAGDQAAQQLAIPGQDPEQIEVRKRDVQEERDARIGARAPEMRRHAHQLIVVNPDEVGALARRRRGEATIDDLVATVFAVGSMRVRKE
jgi:hypothetical protein